MITFFNDHFNFNAFIPRLIVASANNLGVSNASCLQSQAFIDHLRINFTQGISSVSVVSRLRRIFSECLVCMSNLFINKNCITRQ